MHSRPRSPLVTRKRAQQATNRAEIAELYRLLAQLTLSPVVELNRAVAVGMAQGHAAGLELIDRLASHPTLRSYHLLPSARADLLFRLGRREEARGEFERAAQLARKRA